MGLNLLVLISAIILSLVLAFPNLQAICATVKLKLSGGASFSPIIPTLPSLTNTLLIPTQTWLALNPPPPQLIMAPTALFLWSLLSRSHLWHIVNKEYKKKMMEVRVITRNNKLYNQPTDIQPKLSRRWIDVIGLGLLMAGLDNQPAIEVSNESEKIAAQRWSRGGARARRRKELMPPDHACC